MGLLVLSVGEGREASSRSARMQSFRSGRVLVRECGSRLARFLHEFCRGQYSTPDISDVRYFRSGRRDPTFARNLNTDPVSNVTHPSRSHQSQPLHSSLSELLHKERLLLAKSLRQDDLETSSLGADFERRRPSSSHREDFEPNIEGQDDTQPDIERALPRPDIHGRGVPQSKISDQLVLRQGFISQVDPLPKNDLTGFVDPSEKNKKKEEEEDFENALVPRIQHFLTNTEERPEGKYLGIRKLEDETKPDRKPWSPFLTKRKALQLVHARSKRGISDECCRKTCTVSELLGYCY
ncbi:uncharacterized protein LOC143025201 [Oratosquilla oratoria]|uniref:uncharacterized protein LOC143025201 n=1 Tax=Oratosquilla oratoria TaxID=337810 RepID=UPI003F770C0E